MGKDERWPILPFLIIRGIQTLFGIALLGMTANILSFGTVWWAAMGLFISVAILIWMVVNFILFYLGLLLPLVVVIVDGFCFLFLLVSMAGTADSGWLAFDCTYYFIGSLCPTIKGSFAMELLAMFVFLGSLVFAAITLHQHRGNLFGRANANGGVAPASNSAELSVQTSQTHKNQQQQYQQPPQQQQYQQPPQQQQYPQQMQNPQQTVPLTTYPSPVYNSQQPQHMQPQHMQPQQPYTQGPTYEGFNSPSTSPPPTEMQHTGGYSNTSAVPQSTGGWSAGATEMPVSSHPTGAEPRN